MGKLTAPFDDGLILVMTRLDYLRERGETVSLLPCLYHRYIQWFFSISEVT